MEEKEYCNVGVSELQDYLYIVKYHDECYKRPVNRELIKTYFKAFMPDSSDLIIDWIKKSLDDGNDGAFIAKNGLHLMSHMTRNTSPAKLYELAGFDIKANYIKLQSKIGVAFLLGILTKATLKNGVVKGLQNSLGIALFPYVHGKMSFKILIGQIPTDTNARMLCLTLDSPAKNIGEAMEDLKNTADFASEKDLTPEQLANRKGEIELSDYLIQRAYRIKDIRASWENNEVTPPSPFYRRSQNHE